ncbi:MAG: hypothetical protein N2035_10015 [Chthoniobacterales bacterium]|nr:hypothetical protein [Chthoniobacterales bacterium]
MIGVHSSFISLRKWGEGRNGKLAGGWAEKFAWLGSLLVEGGEVWGGGARENLDARIGN